MKVVINKCYGGFGLSYLAVMRYAELAGIPLSARVDDISLRVYAQYGENLTVESPKALVHYRRNDIADENESYFSDHGIEHIAEAHRTWG